MAATDVINSFDPYKKNAYSKEVCFDMAHVESPKAEASKEPSTEVVQYNPAVSEKKTRSNDWELDVGSLISSKKWLLNYGLKKNKLSLHQLLPTIGFKHCDDFDSTLKQPVSSRYGEGLFKQIFRPDDGRTFNISCSRQKLKQIESRLLQSIALYKRRLEWLTSESRRLFGVIEEKAVTIVLDIRNMSPQMFDQYRIALEQVVYEQLTQVVKFNLIRADDELTSYQPECVPVTYDTIQGAVDWVWSLDRLAPVSRSAASEAVLKAIADKHNEAIYLFTEGTSIDTCKEILQEKVQSSGRKIPVHCISFNCDSSDTIRFLRQFSAAVGAKFHAYAVIMELDSYEGEPLDPKTNRANIVLKKKTFGGVPPGSGMREDVILLFEELEEARNNVAQIQAIMEEVPEPKLVVESTFDKSAHFDEKEEYMSSRDWLKKHGLSACSLELFDVLAGVAFKHRDGVVDMKYPPGDNSQTDAITRAKLLNAKYCDRFPVVKWKDGTVVHVQVTPELHRSYEARMKVAVAAYQKRIDWLNQGSRALFGTVIEDQIYILIDTSSSMTPSIQFVKDKLFTLMQEQLRHKMKFNLVSFNSKITSWQNRLVEVNELSLKGAWKWVQGLGCWGSTNTYAALQFALSDPGTQAVYLLTDGRPDQPPRSIIAQVQLQHQIPVHTISFNCCDTEANNFLFDLARATGGRYHYYSEKGKIFDDDQPKSWESEDIRLLKEEIERGMKSLDKVEELRDECSNLSWGKEVQTLKQCSRKHSISNRVSAVPSMDAKDLYRSETPTLGSRPQSAPPNNTKHSPAPPSHPRPITGARIASSMEFRRSKVVRPHSAIKSDRKALSAKKRSHGRLRLSVTHTGHTRTSLLRTLNSSGHFSPNEWLLPETRQLFEQQAFRQKELALVLQRYKMSPYVIDEDDYEDSRLLSSRKPKHRKIKAKDNLSEKQCSSRLWLKKHGLKVKKLTILDALAPTFVPHRATYVPILDKHVMAKVFDNILPLAHVSAKNKQKITLINPNAVNLAAYEEKVKEALDLYIKRLNQIVWDAVGNKMESEEPLPFEENRLRYMQELENAGWEKVQQQDILLMEEEIAKARKYLATSEDLRTAAKQGPPEDQENIAPKRRRFKKKPRAKYGVICSDVSSLTSRSSLSSRSVSRLSERSASRASSRSKSRSISRSPSRSRSPSPKRDTTEGDQRSPVTSPKSNADSFFEVSAAFD